MSATFTVLIALLSAWPLPPPDCVSIPVDVPKALHGSALVFTGTLVDVGEQSRLRFRVDRFWKGRPDKDIVVHVLGQPFIGSYWFRERETYLIFARKLSADERKKAGVSPAEAPAFGLERSCGGAPPFPLKLTAELDSMTRSEKPRE